MGGRGGGKEEDTLVPLSNCKGELQSPCCTLVCSRRCVCLQIKEIVRGGDKKRKGVGKK